MTFFIIGTLVGVIIGWKVPAPAWFKNTVDRIMNLISKGK